MRTLSAVVVCSGLALTILPAAHAEPRSGDGAVFTLEALEEGLIQVDGGVPNRTSETTFSAHSFMGQADRARHETTFGRPLGPVVKASVSAGVDQYRVVHFVRKSGDGAMLRAGDGATESAGAIVDTNTIAGGQMAAAGAHFVDLSWDTTGVAYDIYRNDEKIGSSDTGAFRDNSVSPGGFYLYRVAPSADNVNTEDAVAKKNGGTVYGFPVQIPSGGDSSSLQESAISESAMAAAAAKTDGRVTYRAFIPSKTINLNSIVARLGGCGGYTRFNGNNRGYSIDQWADSKITTEFYAQWPKNKWQYANRVGESHALDSAGRTIARKTASPANTTSEAYSFSSSHAYISQILDGQNPFCSRAGSISASAEGDIYPNGAFKLKGWHKLMPNIELYYTFLRGSQYITATVYRRDLKQPECLIDEWQNCSATFGQW